MAKRQLPKRLFKSRDVVASYKNDRAPVKLMKQMSRDHEDVLQNIEVALVRRHREDPRIDDRAADEALRAALHGTMPTHPRAADLYESLTAIRQLREDIPDDVWRDGLRVVDDSVRRHSQLRPGETSYFEFAGQFV